MAGFDKGCVCPRARSYLLPALGATNMRGKPAIIAQKCFPKVIVVTHAREQLAHVCACACGLALVTSWVMIQECMGYPEKMVRKEHPEDRDVQQ